MVKTDFGNQVINVSGATFGNPDDERTITYGYPCPPIDLKVFMREDGVVVAQKPKRQPKPGKRPYVPVKQLNRWERIG